MKTKLETIPVDEEGATLLHKPKAAGIRRVVVAATVVSFALGLLAATAVRTSPGRHASNLHSKHKHESFDPNPTPWFETEVCGRKCTTDADCEGRFSDSWANKCGVCQNWGESPSMECDRTPPPDVTIKNAHISLVSDSTKCITVADRDDIHLDNCEGGKDHTKQRFTYTYKDGSGRITYDHPTPSNPDGDMNTFQIDIEFSDDIELSWPPGDNLYWAGASKEITIQKYNDFCVAASSTKNGAKILAKKCKDGSSTQQWQIGPM